MKKFILSITLIFLLGGCASTVKEPTDAELNAESAKAYKQMKQDFAKKGKISKNRKWNQMVQRVSARIAKASGENFKWEVMLIEDNQVNAWCMPGGKMAVYTGIMKVLKTEAALAAVMGHEVAHATLRHGKEGYVRAMKTQQRGLLIGLGGLALSELLCETESCKKLTQAGAVLSAIGYEVYNRKFSREDETDSDKVGQIYMAKAGYDPREAPKVWQRMAKGGGQAPPEWISTHPASDERRKRLKSWSSDAMKYYEKAPRKYGLGERI